MSLFTERLLMGHKESNQTNKQSVGIPFMPPKELREANSNAAGDCGVFDIWVTVTSDFRIIVSRGYLLII